MVVLNLGQYDAYLSLQIIITKLSDVQKNFFMFDSQFLNPLTPELNTSAQRCLTRFLLGILLLEPCI
jgi:hypothetical protein